MTSFGSDAEKDIVLRKHTLAYYILETALKGFVH